MKKNNQVYIAQILDSIRKIKKYTKGIGFNKFVKKEEKQSAVIMQLILIGEVSKKLSPAFKAKIKLPWKQIAGFRDRAVHKYFSLDLEDLWQTVEYDLPEMQKKIKSRR
ncbi:MAG: DUF86 domain-containing protein [Patescibacteria group bacterium]